MDYKSIAQEVKNDSFVLASTEESLRNKALAKIAQELKINEKAIIEANQKDLHMANSLPAPIVSRLKFNEGKISDVVEGINNLINLEDPLFKRLLERELDSDLKLIKVTCPIGVIGVIFESRPDALVQIAGLCVKSGNCAILKGGSEAKHTNRALFDVIHKAGVEAGLPVNFITLVEDRAGINELLSYDEYIDLIIPRGSNEFVQYIMANSKIPVMGHADGICHIYVDEYADLEKAIPVIVDAKTQYVAACNAVETLLLHESIADKVLEKLKDFKIKLVPAKSEKDYKEYLDYVLTVKKVSSLDEAIEHINKYGSHHTDCIISEKEESVNKFMTFVDSAGVYANCSTRFADGFRYGFGAEVGISTGKLHARGPVGLDGLVTYKYKLFGNGNIVADYSTGKRKFNF